MIDSLAVSCHALECRWLCVVAVFDCLYFFFILLLVLIELKVICAFHPLHPKNGVYNDIFCNTTMHIHVFPYFHFNNTENQPMSYPFDGG